MVKTRGLKEAKEKLGDLEKIISALLRKKKKIRVFESGCGYGKVMIELKKKFGDKIDIIGMNLKPSHGDKRKMISFALEEGIITKEDIKKMNSIKIIFGDAGKKLPFKKGSIDLIYSQVSSYLYKDKMHFFEEVARVLSKKGIARITSPEENNKLPDDLKLLLRIYDKGKLIPFDRFIRGFRNISRVRLPNGNRPIEVRSGKLDFGLELEATINTNHLKKDWFGVISIYYMK